MIILATCSKKSEDNKREKTKRQKERKETQRQKDNKREKRLVHLDKRQKSKDNKKEKRLADLDKGALGPRHYNVDVGLLPLIIWHSHHLDLIES